MAVQRYKSRNDIAGQADRLVKMAGGDKTRIKRIKEISDRYQNNILNTDRVKSRIERAVFNGAGERRQEKINQKIANWKFNRSDYMGKPLAQANRKALGNNSR